FSSVTRTPARGVRCKWSFPSTTPPGEELVRKTHYQQKERPYWISRRVAHRVHRLSNRRKNRAYGLVDNAAPRQLFAVGHGRALQALRVLSMALRMSRSLRITATSATLAGLPAPRRRS